MDIILTNAFSINMLEAKASLDFQKIGNPAEVILSNRLVDNIIGHADIDRIARGLLEADGVKDIPVGRRETYVLGGPLTALLVAQYRGPRLPEGATTLPEGSKIEWWLVSHHSEKIGRCPNCGTYLEMEEGICYA